MFHSVSLFACSLPRSLHIIMRHTLCLALTLLSLRPLSPSVCSLITPIPFAGAFPHRKLHLSLPEPETWPAPRWRWRWRWLIFCQTQMTFPHKICFESPAEKGFSIVRQTHQSSIIVGDSPGKNNNNNNTGIYQICSQKQRQNGKKNA